MKKILIIIGVALMALWQVLGVAFALASNNLQFNEIAWMGTATSSSDEWIELKNNYSETIDLSGWKIIARDGVPIIDLTGSIVPGGFYLLERTDDETVAGIPADLLYSGALVDTGEFLELWNPDNHVVDAVDASAGWLAGDKLTKQTMDWDGSNWVMSVNAGGTPKAERAMAIVEQNQAIIPVIDLLPVENNTVPVVINNNQRAMIKYLLGEVVINEFISDPSDGEDEWVEIYNNTDKEIDLNGWTIIEGGGKETVLNGTIAAHKYFVVDKIKGSLNNDGDLIVLHDADKNLLDKVAYGNWDDGYIKDNAPVAKDPKSVARKIDGYSSYNNSFDFVKTELATKGTGNVILNEDLQIKTKAVANRSTTTASSTPVKIDISRLATTTPATTTKPNLALKINEILPSPDKGEDEWIELYNDSATKIDLRNWTVDDDDQGGSRPYKFATSTWIAPHGYYVLSHGESKLSLNNDGDKVVLTDDSGNVVDEVVYEKTVVGQAFAKNDKGQWLWTMAMTPGEKNSLMQKEVIDTEQAASAVENNSALNIPAMVSLTEVRNVEKGAYVLVEGTVTVLPGVLGSQYFYIGTNQKTVDGLMNFGLQIYSNKKDFPTLKIGDVVEVVGEISEINGEKRLKTVSKKDIRVVGRGGVVTPQKMTCENIDDSLFGTLVEVEGEISDIKSTGIYLDDGTDELRTYIKKTTRIDYKDYKEAAKIKVIGIVGSAKSELRLLPRSKDDIIILEKKVAAETAKGADLKPQVLGAILDNSDLVIAPRDGISEATKYLIILVSGGFAIFLIWWFKFGK